MRHISRRYARLQAAAELWTRFGQPFRNDLRANYRAYPSGIGRYNIVTALRLQDGLRARRDAKREARRQRVSRP